jgi:hypothetical protein
MPSPPPNTPDDLPIPDIDQIPAASLEHRIRSLNGPELETLLTHERKHAQRAPVMSMLTARMHQLDEGAEPTRGSAGTPADQPRPGHSASPVSPATAARPVHPPPHGTPDQSGKPKGDQR